MAGLWRKEFYSVRPFLGLVLALISFGFLNEMVAEIPNARPIAKAYTDYVALERGGTIMVFLVVFAMASGLLVREYDEGSMEFLDSLPVSRSRVFVVKVTVALLVLVCLLVLDVGTGFVLHALSRTSLDRSFHFGTLATALVMRMCQLFVVLSIGLALSFLRRFGWLVMGLLFWGYMLLREGMPAITLLDLFALGEPRFEGDRWVVSGRLLAVQLMLGVSAIAVAYGLFLGVGDYLLRGLQQLTRHRWGNALLAFGGFLVVIVVGSLAYRAMEQEFGDMESDEHGVTITYPEWSIARANTQYYQFMFPTNLSGAARELMDDGDSVHETVRSFLGAEAGDPIVVDATSSMQRHAGIAYWNKIRLDLFTVDDVETLRSILAHETCHVFLERLSDSRLGEKMNSAKFFHEGVASYVEHHLFSPQPPLDRQRSVAAVMQARHEVDFDEIVDNDRLTARLDSNLVYPLGEIFVDALVQLHGEEAIGNVVRAIVRDDAPPDLTGAELWRDLFQACEYSFDEVVGEFFGILDDEVEKHRQLIDKLPRLRGALEHDDRTVTVRVLGEGVDGWEPVCRFRDAEETDERYYLNGEYDGANTFSLTRLFFGARISYQLGLSDGESRVIYEPWLEATLD